VIFVAFLVWAILMRKVAAPNSGRVRTIGIAVALLAAVLVLYGITAAMDRLDFLIPPSTLWNNLQMLHYLMPLTGSAVLLVCAAGIIRYRRLWPALFRTERLRLARKDRFLLLTVGMTGAFYLAFILYPEPCPRNAAMITFPMAVFAGTLLARRRLGALAALPLIVAGLLLSEWDMPAFPPGVHRRSSDLLERNLAFVEDLHANRDACAFLARCGRGAAVSAPQPFRYMLSIPEMGYVRTPPGQVLPGGDEDGSSVPPDAMWIFTENDFPGGLPPGPEDRILYWNRLHNDAPVYIYRKSAP